MSPPAKIIISAPVPEFEQHAAETTQQLEEMTVEPVAPAARIISVMVDTQV